MDEKIKNRICAGIQPSTLCAKNFFAPILKKIIYLESGQLTYTENNNFLKFLRREYSVRIPGLIELTVSQQNYFNFIDHEVWQY